MCYHLKIIILNFNSVIFTARTQRWMQLQEVSLHQEVL